MICVVKCIEDTISRACHRNVTIEVEYFGDFGTLSSLNTGLRLPRGKYDANPFGRFRTPSTLKPECEKKVAKTCSHSGWQPWKSEWQPWNPG